MVAISQTFNQRDNNNNGKDNDKIDADANAAPLDVDEKSHWTQFAAPGPLATPFNIDAETIADAARAGVDETPDADANAETKESSEGDAATRPDLTKTIVQLDDGEPFVCWLPNDVDADAELARFVKAASKTAVRVALAEAKSSLLTQILTLPTPRRVADIRRYYHQTVQGLALSVLAALGTDDEKFAVDNYLTNAMIGAASQNDDETPVDAEAEKSSRLPLDEIDREAFLKLGKFYNRVAIPFIRNDGATFDRILAAIKAVFPPNELLRPWNVADKTSAFCDALQNGGMTQAAALPLAKEAVKNATEAASALYWGGAGPEPKQRWNVSCRKPTNDVDAAEAEAGE